jgi:hydrogenase nickel incorporation protein HypB
VLESRVLARNDQFAEKNRAFLKQQGCVAVNFISSPGSGKTYLLEKTLEGLRDRVKCAVIAGDQQTDNDAVRLKNKGAPVVQIETGSSCHLNAEQIGETLKQVLKEDTKLLFIENVGNLVCPAAFDLGENIKIAVLSVTEGEDKPLKYPVIFHDAAASVVTKTDLIEHLDVDMGRYRDSLNKIQPGGRIFELSALTGAGMDAWLDYLEGLVH